MTHRSFTSIWLAALFVACAMSFAEPAAAYTGETCVNPDDESRALCIVMIGAMRGSSAGTNASDPACAASNPDDLSVSYAIIDWIKASPERQHEDLGKLINEALISVDPCARGPLMPINPETDPLDVD
jgi:hypothetical protein